MTNDKKFNLVTFNTIWHILIELKQFLCKVLLATPFRPILRTGQYCVTPCTRGDVRDFYYNEQRKPMANEIAILCQ